ncbi:ankyrin repeat domain-containing protein 54-like [Ctenocephalides felis]|uniref:ankyrin repeat domain-containing protein 54-like n=1 Tax=Ctenocephalides felis TaxID=7515 RepID=UPI000E6E4842|nr:ankyrin repeat domain-containing protein 54-like [Ctenocephalides felis]
MRRQWVCFRGPIILDRRQRRHTCVYDSKTLRARRLRNAVSLNNLDLVRRLLQTGVSANSSDSQRRSPLHLASCKGYTQMVKLLIEHGADANIKDDLGNTPLHLAACTNNIEIITLLLDGGADVSSLDNCGRNPLQLAQSKLRLIIEMNKKRIEPPEMQKLKDQVQQVVSMLLTFLQKQKDARVELDDLSDKLNKLKTSEINDIDGEVSKLLDDLQILEIKK